MSNGNRKSNKEPQETPVSNDVVPEDTETPEETQAVAPAVPEPETQKPTAQATPVTESAAPIGKFGRYGYDKDGNAKLFTLVEGESLPDGYSSTPTAKTDEG